MSWLKQNWLIHCKEIWLTKCIYMHQTDVPLQNFNLLNEHSTP